MEHNIYAIIKSIYPSFTKAEKVIADCVLANAREMVYMTISQFAAACNIGETSVFRFCRRLGEPGFHAFKVDLAKAVSDSHDTPDLNDCIVSPLDSFDLMLQKILNNSISVLNETYRLIDSFRLSTATQWLSEAEHICFFGTGPCSASAMSAQNRFMAICRQAEYVADSRMQMLRAAMMTPKDVAVVLCYTGKTKETLAIAEAAKNAQARVICLCRFSRSPLAEMSDLVLLCAGNEGPCQSGAFNMKTASLFLIETLTVAYCKANPQKTDSYRARARSALSFEVM